MKQRIFSMLVTLCMVCALIPAFPERAEARTVVKLGKYVQMGTYYGEPILWRCVDTDENGSLMLADKIITVKPMDAAGDYSTGSHSRDWSRRESSGSGYWADSNMRSWLNSEADAGNVEWLCGNPPDKNFLEGRCNAYDQEAGFLTNFTQEEIDAIKEVTQKFILPNSDANLATSEFKEGHKYYTDIAQVVANYDKARSIDVEDRMFILDVKQLYAVYENRGILGDKYYIGEPTAECVKNSEFTSSELAVGKNGVICSELRDNSGIPI